MGDWPNAGITNRLSIVEEGGRRLVRRAYARWPYAADGRPQAAVEAELHRRLMDAGVPVPGVVREEAFALLLELVEGEQLATVEAREGGPALAAAWRELGAALARVHGLEESGCAGGWAAAELAANAGRLHLPARLTERLEAALAGLGERPCRLLHGDPNPSNVLVRRQPGGWSLAALIDWEAAGPGDPAWDLARLVFGRRAEGLGVPPEFWAGYGRPPAPELLAAYEPVFHLRLAGRRVNPRVRFLVRAADAYVAGLA